MNCKLFFGFGAAFLLFFVPLEVRAQATGSIDPVLADSIDSVVETAIRDGQFPGCVICYGRQSGITYLKAFGDRQVLPAKEAMTVETVFDMASITKPVATATSVMLLVDRGKLKLSDRVADYFPAFANHGKQDITIQQLLVHQSGLIPDNALADYRQGPEVAWERICNLGLVCDVGTKFRYSDVNFIVLAKLVEKVSGQDVHEYSRQNIFAALRMTETGFLPHQQLRLRAAATEQREGEWIKGQVHDPRAYALGGIAGHAGLFSTATDLSVYASMMLGRGTLAAGRNGNLEPVPILSSKAWEQMTDPYPVSSGIRGLGWDKQTGFSSNKGTRLSDAAFGHGGFTGTVFWVDPDRDLFFVFLSTRLHPDGKGSVNRLAGTLLDLVVEHRSEN